MADDPQIRPVAESTRFQKGRSGNPGGRPKGLSEAVRARAGKDGKKLVDGLYALALGTPQDRLTVFGEPVTVDTRDRHAALKELLDRGFGKPAQALEHSGPQGAALSFTISVDDSRERDSDV